MGFSDRGLCGPIGDTEKIFVLLEDAQPLKEDVLSFRVTIPYREGWVDMRMGVDRHGWCKIIGEGAHKLSLQCRELIHGRRNFKLLLFLLLLLLLLLVLILLLLVALLVALLVLLISPYVF